MNFDATNSEWTVTVERPVAVQSELARLWRDNLTLEGSPAEKFAWLYEKAPIAADAVFLLRRQGKVVGTAGLGRRELQLDGEKLQLGILQDLAVDADHRTLAPALQLVRETKKHALERCDVLIGYPNQKAQGVFARAGYTHLGSTTRFVRVLRRAAYLDRALAENRFGARVGALLQQEVLKWPTRSLALPLVDRLDVFAPWRGNARWHVVREPPQFSQDELGLRALRSSSFLQWRWLNDRVRWLRSHDTSAAIAWRHVKNAAAIVDFIGEPLMANQALRAAAQDAYHQGCDHISLRKLGGKWLDAALVQNGFVPREGSRAVFVAVRDSMNPRGRRRVLDASEWLLMDADEDV